MEFLYLFTILGIIAVVHEFGHFIVAKKLGYEVDIFSIGFGKTLFSKEYNGTMYKISLIPLGGYVSLPKEINNKIHNFLIALAGPMFNLLLCCLIVLFLSLSKNFTFDKTCFLLLDTVKNFFLLIPLFFEFLFHYIYNIAEEIQQPMNISRIVEQNFLLELYKFSLIIGSFNLLPIPPLDGSRIFFLFFSKKYEKYIDIAAICSVLFFVSLELTGVYKIFLYYI